MQQTRMRCFMGGVFAWVMVIRGEMVSVSEIGEDAKQKPIGSVFAGRSLFQLRLSKGRPAWRVFTSSNSST